MGKLVYERMNGSLVYKVRTTSFTIGLDYRPGQTYINSKQQRFEVNADAPKFTLTHTFGIKNMLGGEFNYNLTELSAYKRIWFGSWGKLDVRIKAGAQWNKVPYYLLIILLILIDF